MQSRGKIPRVFYLGEVAWIKISEGYRQPHIS